MVHYNEVHNKGVLLYYLIRSQTGFWKEIIHWKLFPIDLLLDLLNTKSHYISLMERSRKYLDFNIRFKQFEHSLRKKIWIHFIPPTKHWNCGWALAGIPHPPFAFNVSKGKKSILLTVDIRNLPIILHRLKKFLSNS